MTPPLEAYSLEHFRNIGLLGRIGTDGVAETLQALLAILSQRSVNVVVESALKDLLPGRDLQFAERKMLGEICDLAIVVGGDGSMLAAARSLAMHQVSVLGINRGKLGFLTDIHPDELGVKVNAVLDGEYRAEKRFLLDVVVKRKGHPIASGTALNDIVVNSGGSARMIEFDLYMDDIFVYTQSSDGLIISTPTGSTAYALSGGGPIMHPSLEAMVLVPMFPHTLSARPIVVHNETEIKMVIGDSTPYLSCDGQVRLDAAPGDSIYITKKPQRLTILHPTVHDFYAACRNKLGWSSRLTKSSS